MASDDSKPKVPYTRYAFANPYNYAALGGVVTAAVLTGNWWLGLAGAGCEAIWMLFAPDSRLLRATWFDKRFKEEQAAAQQMLLDKKFKLLPESDAMRCLALREKQDQILRLAHENPTFTIDLLSGELGKLESLVKSFVDLSVTCSRYQDYLKSVDLDEIERDLRRYQQILEKDPEEGKRDLARKNIQVLERRKAKYGEIRGYLSSARGQLELIENSFRLLADQIVTMQSPTELGGQLDELMDGVEAVRQTTRDTEKLLQAIER
jgi:hypothetical protein